MFLLVQLSGGVSLPVYPIGAVLFRKAGIPKRFSRMYRSWCFYDSNDSYSGYQIQNTIPEVLWYRRFSLLLFTGIIAALIMFIGGMVWNTYQTCNG